MREVKIILLGVQTTIAQTILGQLEAHHYPPEKILLMDHHQNTPEKSFYMGEEKNVLPVDLFSEKAPYIVLLCDKKIPLSYPKKNIPKRARVIDCTGVITKAPCLIPGINQISSKTRLICAPSSLTVLLAHTLFPLKKHLQDIQIVALIGTSFLGQESAQKLRQQTRAVFTKKAPPYDLKVPPLAFNLIPEIIPWEKEICPHQLKCITGLSPLFFHCFAPIFRGFSVHICGKTKQPLNLKKIFQDNPFIALLEETAPDFIMSSAATLSETKVYIHHILQKNNTLSFWLTGDDLQSGMALNVIQILKQLENFV